MTKLVTFLDHRGSRVGTVLADGSILDLSIACSGHPALIGRTHCMVALIEGGRAAVDAVRALANAPPPSAVIPPRSVRLLAPIPRPSRNVFCVGRNYMDHVAEGDRTRGITNSELPKYPQFFTKAPDTVIGPEEWVPAFTEVTKWLDYEVELVIVIGAAGHDIPKEKALDHVFGWTIGNDVTGRDLQRRYGQWFKGKSLDRSCPMGPWIVPADELDGLNTGIRLYLNGEKRQDSHTSKMIFDVRDIIHQLSLGFTLKPGDLILSGTPEGVGYAMQPPQTMQPGDVMVCEIDGIGQLRNAVRAE